jgi:hypothetical protein
MRKIKIKISNKMKNSWTFRSDKGAYSFIDILSFIETTEIGRKLDDVSAQSPRYSQISPVLLSKLLMP